VGKCPRKRLGEADDPGPAESALREIVGFYT
jgi:hypothetical protein